MPPAEGRRRWKAGAAVVCAGLFYGYVLIPMGVRLRCPFRVVTGLRCPGCGVTDLCLALLHGRFCQAPGYNWGLTLSLPALAWLWSRHLRGRTGRADRRVTAGVLIWLAAWGVIRNLTGL